MATNSHLYSGSPPLSSRYPVKAATTASVGTLTTSNVTYSASGSGATVTAVTYSITSGYYSGKYLLVGVTVTAAGSDYYRAPVVVIPASASTTSTSDVLLTMSDYQLTAAGGISSLGEITNLSTTTRIVETSSPSITIEAQTESLRRESSTVPSFTTIDGVSLSAGDRILVKDQTDKTENGVYEYMSTVLLRRSADYHNFATVDLGTWYHVDNGSVNGGKDFEIANQVIKTNDRCGKVYLEITSDDQRFQSDNQYDINGDLY